MVRLLGILFIVIGICLIVYAFIPSVSGFSVSTAVIGLSGALCIGAGFAIIRFSREHKN